MTLTGVKIDSSREEPISTRGNVVGDVDVDDFGVEEEEKKPQVNTRTEANTICLIIDVPNPLCFLPPNGMLLCKTLYWFTQTCKGRNQLLSISTGLIQAVAILEHAGNRICMIWDYTQ